MHAAPGVDRHWLLSAGVMVAAMVALVGATVAPAPVPLGPLAFGALALAGGVMFRRSLLQWPSLLAALILVILLIPIKRYRIAVDLPFELEPYRIAVVLIAAVWGSSLLIDRRVRLRA